MPSATFIHDGDAIDYTPTTDTPAGTVVVMGSLVGVAKRDIKAGQLGALAVTGVFDFPKATGANTGSGAGVNVYWDDVNDRATGATAGPLLGKTTRIATDTDPTFRVRLMQ